MNHHIWVLPWLRRFKRLSCRPLQTLSGEFSFLIGPQPPPLSLFGLVLTCECLHQHRASKQALVGRLRSAPRLPGAVEVRRARVSFRRCFSGRMHSVKRSENLVRFQDGTCLDSWNAPPSLLLQICSYFFWMLIYNGSSIPSNVSSLLC